MKWTKLDFIRKLEVKDGSVRSVSFTWLVTCFTNFRNCLNPNKISEYFKFYAPTLEEYDRRE